MKRIFLNKTWASYEHEEEITFFGIRFDLKLEIIHR